MTEPEHSSTRQGRRSLYGEHTPWGFLAILFAGMTIGGAVARAAGVTDSLNIASICVSVVTTLLISRLVLFLRRRRR